LWTSLSAEWNHDGSAGWGQIRVAYTAGTVLFQGKPITITDRTPLYTPEQREKRKKEIEHTLFGIFKKYAETPKQSA
jgi:hypothetical protein